MHTARKAPPPATPVEDLAWVFDGVQVSLTKRNLYVCGRTHTLTPQTQSTRQRAVSAFRERLLIPDPHLRSVLKSLVLAGSEGVRCDEHTISLVRWLNTDSSDHDGGWALKPYVRLVWDEWDDEQGEDIPMVSTATVWLHHATLKSLREVLLHWSSSTPEVHVLPPATAELARQWLRHVGIVPFSGLESVSKTSVVLYQLMKHDTVATDPHAGRFWRLSDNLQNLMTRMVMTVHRSLKVVSEDSPVPPESPLGDDVEELSAYVLPSGVARSEPTDLELMLWHAEWWPGFPVTRRVGRYAFDEGSNGVPKSRAKAAGRAVHLCSKYPTRPAERNRGYGLLTAACARCYRIAGFSVMRSPESPKAVFELLVTRFAARALQPPDVPVLNDPEPAVREAEESQSPGRLDHERPRTTSQRPALSPGLAQSSANAPSRLPRAAAARCREMFSSLSE